MKHMLHLRACVTDSAAVETNAKLKGRPSPETQPSERSRSLNTQFRIEISNGLYVIVPRHENEKHLDKGEMPASRLKPRSSREKMLVVGRTGEE